MTTIDALNLDRCKLIKADVEGMELRVLLGAKKTIKRLRPFLFVENDREANSASLIQQLLEWDYRVFRHNSPLFDPINAYRNPVNIFEDWESTNLLAVPSQIRFEPGGLEEITE